MAAFVACVGCDKVELVTDVEPGVASATVERLSHKGIQARARMLSPTQAAVEVDSTDVSRAVRELDCAIAPLPEPCQVAESSLLPTPRQDAARQRRRRECELSRDLAHLPGVVRGQVRIADSETPAMDAQQTPASVSVWLEATNDFEENSVRRFLRGAVPNVRDDSIHLVAAHGAKSTDKATAHGSPAHLVHLGPLRLAPQSLALAKIMLALLLGTNLLMAVMLVLVWGRTKRSRDS